jgi:hypothetical protein
VTQIQSDVARQGLQKERMAFDLINTKKFSTMIAPEFSSIDQIMQYAGTKAFAGLPGFDDEGNPESKTESAVSSSKLPIISIHGGTTTVKIPYKHAEGEGMLTLNMRPGANPLMTQYFKTIIANTDPTTPNGAQTIGTLQGALFDLKYGNVLDPVMGNHISTQVNKERPRVILTSVTVPDPYGRGMLVNIVKNKGESGEKEFYTIENAISGARLGKEYNSVEAVKEFIGGNF